MDLMHINSVRAGYIDLEGCTVVDMLPRQGCAIAFNASSADSITATSSQPALSAPRHIPHLAVFLSGARVHWQSAESATAR